MIRIVKVASDVCEDARIHAAERQSPSTNNENGEGSYVMGNPTACARDSPPRNAIKYNGRAVP
jgi:hypothetical protein